MNATETIFALALASNCKPQQHFQAAQQRISEWGEVQFSPVYIIPCRDGIGANYWNAACLLRSSVSSDAMINLLKQLEQASARVRPSHQITLDVDLIAWGPDLQHMQLNEKKLPLALDVKVPMFDLWQDEVFQHERHNFPKVEENS